MSAEWGHCCACAQSEDRVTLLGIAGQVVVEGGGDHELHAQASALLSAAFKRAQAAIEVALLPKLGP